MTAHRQPGVGDERPERVVAIVEVVGQAELVREHRELERLHAERHDPLDLLARGVDVVDRDLRVHDESLRVDRAELEHGVVERARRLAPAVPAQVEVPERADLAVQHLGFDAVGVHVEQALVRVAVAGTAGRRVWPQLERGRVHPRRSRLRHPLPELDDRAVVLVVELGCEVLLHLGLADRDV